MKKMTIKERLMEEFECAIMATFGDKADKKEEEVELSKFDIDSIAMKVKWYMDL